MPNLDGIKNYQDNPPIFSTKPALKRPERKRRIWKWLVVVLIILGGAAAYFGSTILSRANQIFTSNTSIFTRFRQLVVSDDTPLKGEETGAVNILLLGMGGPGHDGPFLTDTMIVASINVKTSEVSLVSLPRDFMVRLQGRGYNKVNAAYAYAEMDKEGSGGEAAIAKAEEITGLEIPYYAAVDFKGFVKAVDRVGGLDITIDRTFTDAEYPNYNKGYLPPQTFTKGQEHMGGERALIFARSRHGNNGEGSDFARSDRQKKIMLGFKDEVLKLNIGNLATLNGLLSDFTENFRTNMEPHELKRLADLGGKINGENVFSLSLDPQGGLICDGSYDLATGRPAPALPPPPPPATPSTTGEDEETNTTTPATPVTPVSPSPTPAISRAYVVVPCSGKTMTDIHQYLKTSIALANLQKEQATVEIQNTTGKVAAIHFWRDLEDRLEIKFTSAKPALERSIIYDNTKGAKPRTLEYLKSLKGYTVSDLPYTQSQSDFVIILGNDAL